MVFFIYGPAVENTIESFATKTKYNTSFPQFGEEWSINLVGDWRKAEIQISVKDYNLIGDNRTIGVHTCKISKYKQLPNLTETATLKESNSFNNYGRTILAILNNRVNDPMAKRFVQAKLENDNLNKQP